MKFRADIIIIVLFTAFLVALILYPQIITKGF